MNFLKFTDGNNFTIKAGEEKEIEQEYTSEEAGVFRGLIDVVTEGKTFQKQIDVNATCVEFMKFIIDDQGEEINKMDFDTVIFGGKKSLQGYLVNNSPEHFYFKINYILGLQDSYQEEQNLQV